MNEIIGTDLRRATKQTKQKAYFLKCSAISSRIVRQSGYDWQWNVHNVPLISKQSNPSKAGSCATRGCIEEDIQDLLLATGNWEMSRRNLHGNPIRSAPTNTVSFIAGHVGQCPLDRPWLIQPCNRNRGQVQVSTTDGTVICPTVLTGVVQHHRTWTIDAAEKWHIIIVTYNNHQATNISIENQQKDLDPIYEH